MGLPVYLGNLCFGLGERSITKGRRSPLFSRGCVWGQFFSFMALDLLPSVPFPFSCISSSPIGFASHLACFRTLDPGFLLTFHSIGFVHGLYARKYIAAAKPIT